MKRQPSIEDIVDRIGILPDGFKASASAAGPGLVPADDWCICISGTYGGQEYNEIYYLASWQLGFLSSVRDKLMLRHWERMCAMMEPEQLAGQFEAMHPYSSMDLLHHAPR